MIPAAVETLGVKAFTSLREALHGADVVMALRIQHERLAGILQVVGVCDRAHGHTEPHGKHAMRG